MKFYATYNISENMHETPEGYLICLGVPIARTGEMVYGTGESPLEPGPDGTVVVTRDADEVFRPETIASFQGKAVTILHPSDFVTPENWSNLTKGVIQNVRQGTGEQQNDLIADLLITDSVAINLVKNGLREVSCGYEAEYTQTGEGRGVQSNIIGNHLALVDQGRAGSSYAIIDHKGKGLRMKMKDKFKAIFAKAQDEAMQLVGDEADPKEKEEKAKDEAPMAYDEMMKAVKDLGAKIDAMSKPKDELSAPVEGEPAVADEEVAPGLEDRLKTLEASVAKILEAMAAKAGDSDEEVESEDESCEDESDIITDEDEEASMTGDSISRVEILAPGLAARGKDAKAKALKTAYSTTDGKAVIDQLTGGKAPDLKNAAQVETLFIAASEILKVKRNSDLSRTKTRDFDSTIAAAPKGAMTAEAMNQLNDKHYNRAH